MAWRRKIKSTADGSTGDHVADRADKGQIVERYLTRSLIDDEHRPSRIRTEEIAKRWIAVFRHRQCGNNTCVITGAVVGNRHVEGDGIAGYRTSGRCAY